MKAAGASNGLPREYTTTTSDIKRGQKGVPKGGGFINRRQGKERKRRLRTCPLELLHFSITSKMAVNFIFVSGHQNVVSPPHEWPFRLFYESVSFPKNAVGS
jgi:hypothetical protein